MQQRYVESAGDVAGFELWLATDIDVHITLLQQFLGECGLRPITTRCIPGALKYTHYDYFKRLVMRLIAKEQGRPTDTTRDYEYTNWVDVEAFVDEVLAEARIPGSPHVAAAARP